MHLKKFRIIVPTKPCLKICDEKRIRREYAEHCGAKKKKDQKTKWN